LFEKIASFTSPLVLVGQRRAFCDCKLLPAQLSVFLMKYIVLLTTNLASCVFLGQMLIFRSHVQLLLFYYDKDEMKRHDLFLCCTGSIETEMNFGPLM